MKTEIVVWKGLTEIVRIRGWKVVNEDEITDEEVKQIIHLETLLEKLTGYRFHINQV